MQKPFIPYARVSSDEQKDAETIKNQIAEVGRSSLPLADWITDDGVSGLVPFHERPGGARVLQLLRTGAYAGIVTLNHKRIGRDAYVIHLAVRQIEQELRCDIIAVREPVPSQMAPGARALMRAVYAGVAQHDREEDLAQLRAGKERAAREGRYCGGGVPFGMKVVEEKEGRRRIRRIVPDDETAPLVRRAFELYAEGRSQDRVAEFMTASTGRQWRQGRVSEMLRNPFYKGEGVWRGIGYEDYQPAPIVSPGLWDTCARLRRDNELLSPRNARNFYLLSGLIRCGLCDRSMTGGTNLYRKQGRRPFPYYRCTSHADHGVRGCALGCVNARKVERLVWSGIETFAAAPGKVLDRIRKGLSAPIAPATWRDLERALNLKRQERERVIGWARQGRITEEELDAQLRQIRAELVALEDERARQEAASSGAQSAQERLRDAEAFLEDIARALNEMTDERRRAIVRRAVPRVIVTPRDGRKEVKATYCFSPRAPIATGMSGRGGSSPGARTRRGTSAG